LKAKILVVDDEDGLRMLLRDNLEFQGYDVIEAENGREAMELAWRDRPDLVFIDIGLPDVDGWEVCNRLRKDPRSKDTPLVVTTGSVKGDVHAEGRKHGVEHCILKPYDPLDAVRVAREILKR